jgi:hypothetical protein
MDLATAGRPHALGSCASRTPSPSLFQSFLRPLTVEISDNRKNPKNKSETFLRFQKNACCSSVPRAEEHVSHLRAEDR